MEQDQPQPAVLDREALLGEIRAGRMVAIGERTAHDEAGVDFLLSLSAEALAPSPDPASATEAPLEGTPQHETSTFRLDPGSAVLRADGLLPIIIEGGESGSVWSAPGDFALFLEAGNGEHTGLVRELLVGHYRSGEDGDFEHKQGVFFTPDQLDNYRQHMESALRSLAQQIGIDPESDQLAEQMPRGESWLAERAAADAAKARMDAEIASLKDSLAAASELIKGLESQIPPAPASQPEPVLDTASEPQADPEPVVSESLPKTKAGK